MVVDRQAFTKLTTKALENKQTRYVTSFPDAILKPVQREWKKYIVEQMSKYGYVPSPEQMALDVSTFIPSSSELPLDRLFEDATKLLQGDFYQEEIHAFMEQNLKNGKLAFDDIRDFTETLRVNSTVLEPSILVYNDFSREEYSVNSRRSKFGIPMLDEATSGILGGDYVLAIGGFKSGKTTFMNTIARLAFDSLKENIVVFAMESSTHEMAGHFDAMFGRMSASQFRKGISEETAKRLNVVEKAMKGRDNKLVIAPRISHPSQIVDVIESLPWDIDKVFIDGVNLLGNNSAIDMAQQTVGLTQASRLLKEIAIKKNIAVIGVTQANRQGAKSSDAPDATDVGGAIALVQDCNVAVSTKYTTATNGVKGVYCKLSLNRHGDTGAKFLLGVDYSTYDVSVYPMVDEERPGLSQLDLVGLKELENSIESLGIDPSTEAAQAIIRDLV